MKRISLCALVAGCAVASSFGAVVHDAGLDLMMNARSANVYTNRYGGVWSFMRASFNPTGYVTGTDRTLLPSVRTYDAVDGFTVARGPAEGTSSNPVIAVNPSPNEDKIRLSNNANGYFAGQPGQISIHPGDKLSAVLRFTVPRDGRYSVEAKFWHQNSGFVGMVALTNGVAPKAWQARQGSLHVADVYDYSIKSAVYKAGDTIEIIVDRQQKYASNATGVKFAVTEEDVEAVDLNAAFASGGVKSYYVAAANPDGAVTALKGGCARTNPPGFSGYSKTGSSSTYPWVVTNALDVIAGEGANKNILAPGDILALPDDRNALVLRYEPTVSGRYDVGVELYDAASNADHPGVTISVRQGGNTLGSCLVSSEMADAKLSDSLIIRDIPVLKGIPLDLVLDSNDGKSGDNTVIRWGLVKTRAFYDANAAMVADQAAHNPFADGLWALGTVPRDHYASGDLTVFTCQQQKTVAAGTAKGWGSRQYDGFASPYWGVNLAGVELPGLQTWSLGVDEMLCHPQAASPYASVALEFKAPADGVYAAHMIARDIALSTSVSNSVSGVDVHIVLANQYPGNGVTRAEGYPEAEDVIPLCRLDADRVCLRKDECLRFVVGCNGTTPNSDATGVRAWVVPLETGADLKSVNVDLNGFAAGENPTTLAEAPGRFGWSGEKWNGVRVADGLAALQSRNLKLADGKTYTMVQVGVTRRNGGISASAANTSGTNAMIKDGIVSANTSDIYDFTLSGLTPNAEYDLAFYSRTLEATRNNAFVAGAFTIGGVTKNSTEDWFAHSHDCATFRVTADADGQVVGTYASASPLETERAFWCGFSVTGKAFPSAQAPGMAILIR